MPGGENCSVRKGGGMGREDSPSRLKPRPIQIAHMPLCGANNPISVNEVKPTSSTLVNVEHIVELLGYVMDTEIH